MDAAKTGKFICECRKSKNLTQQELAVRLNVTDSAISNWENGRRLPDYSVLPPLCVELGITINEFFVGEKIPEETFKTAAESNLLDALKESAFTVKDRVNYARNKWKKDHLFGLTAAMILILGAIGAGIYLIYAYDNAGLLCMGIVLSVIFSVGVHNSMSAYIEKSAYGKDENFSSAELLSAVQKLAVMKAEIIKLNDKPSALKYVAEATDFSKNDCLLLYDLLIN